MIGNQSADIVGDKGDFFDSRRLRARCQAMDGHDKPPIGMRPSNSSRNMAPFKDFESVATTPQLLAARPHGPSSNRKHHRRGVARSDMYASSASLNRTPDQPRQEPPPRDGHGGGHGDDRVGEQPSTTA